MIERSDSEVLDAVPVLADTPSSGANELVSRSAPPLAQTAAVAVGGFVAGAAALGLVRRRRAHRGRVHRAALAAAPPTHRIARAGRRARRAAGIAEVVASRSLLIDVHLLGSSARDR